MFYMSDRREQAAVPALGSQACGEWFLLAQLLESVGSALRVARGEWSGFEPPELRAVIGEQVVDEAEIDVFERQIVELAEHGVRLVTVLDDDYPTNLRLIYNRP